MQKIVCISDTHEQHELINVPGDEEDILIHAGDFTWRGDISAIIHFANWLDGLPHKYKILIAGNHDILFEENPGLAVTLLGGTITYLYNSEVIVDTDLGPLKIWGSPWSPKFSYGWAFNLADEAHAKRNWERIPDDIDVLVTHGPPQGILDQMPRFKHFFDKEPEYYENTGCPVLRRELERVNPRLHIFGHIHPQHGRAHDQGRLFCNASILKDDGPVLNKPIVYPIDKIIIDD